MKDQVELRILAYEAAQVKRKILNDVQRGRLKTLVKQEVIALIVGRPRVNIAPDQMDWPDTIHTYLDGWYAKLEQEVATHLNGIDSHLSFKADGDNRNLDCRKLEAELAHQRRLVQAQQQLIDRLRVENEELRLMTLQRHGKIDGGSSTQ